MVRPTRHPRTGVYRIRAPIPAHLRETSKRLYGVRAEFIQSLRTKDPKEAKARAAPVLDKFAAWLRAAEAQHNGKVVHLTDREVATLCGRWLAQQTEKHRDNVGRTPESLDEEADYLGDVARGLADDEEYSGNPYKDAVEAMAEEVEPMLAAEGLAVDRDSLERLSARLLIARWHFIKDLEERARSGRWVQTISPGDFPEGRVGAAMAATGLHFDALLRGFALNRGWNVDAKPVARALYDRQRTLERLAAFLGHRDAERVTKADAVRWKEEALGRRRTAATVRNDLSEMAAMWDWAIRNSKLDGAENPFRGILPRKAAKRSREPRAFTDAEAKLILEAARHETGCLRWLPWVLCLTGARLNEVCQSDKADVVNQDGVPVIRIHDVGEGRTVKNADSRRTVPIHPALMAEGFLDYVASLPDGAPLFDVSSDKVFGLRSVTAGRKVARWLRYQLGIVDPLISPNHSWRHWFIERCRRVVMPVEVRSAITGHSAKLDESASYGAGMGTFVQVLARWIAKVPCPVTEDATVQNETRS